MAISADPSSIPISIYQNIQSNQPAKLEKIPNFFSKESNQMTILEEKDPIYDVPQNNRPVERLTLYERVSRIFSNLYKRISNLFSRKPSQMEMLEEKVKQLSEESAHLNLFTAQLQQATQQQHHYICVNVKRIEHLEGYVHFLKCEVDSKEVQINSLKETILSLEEELYSNRTQVSQDSGFLDTTEKKQSFFSKTSQLLKTKIG